MIWVIYRDKNKFEAPRAVPFDDDSPELVSEWMEQKKEDYQILDVTISIGD